MTEQHLFYFGANLPLLADRYFSSPQTLIPQIQLLHFAQRNKKTVYCS